jgi:phage major head subunit gpT-like protein
MIVNQVNLDAAFTGFKTLYAKGIARAKPTYEAVATVVPSTTEKEVYPWLGQTTKFREWLGDRALQGLGTHGFTIVNKHFEDSVAINRDKFEDDSYGIFAPVIEQLGQDAAIHPDQLVWNLCKSGISSLCYDGQYFFDTDHPGFDQGGAGTVVANVDSGGSSAYWYLFDTSRVVKPFIFQKRKEYNFVPLNKDGDPNVFMRNEFIYGVDARVNAGYGLWQLGYASNQALTAASYQAARAAMGTIRLENGDVMDVTPNLLVVSSANEGAARTLLHAEIIANTTNVWQNSADLLVVPRLG